MPRKETRLTAVLPVRVYGMSAAGKPFAFNVATLNVSRGGALLSNVGTQLNVGDIIGIQKGTNKAKFRVQWFGSTGTPAAGRIGVECLEPAKNLFGIEEDLSAPGRSTNSAVERRTPNPTMTTTMQERRAFPRYTCDIGIQIKTEAAPISLWSRCSDICEGGCYVDTRTPADLGSVIEVTFFLEPDSVAIPALVRTVFPGIGMGLQFLYKGAEQRERMQRFIKDSFVNQHAETVLASVSPFAELEKLVEVTGQMFTWAKSSDLDDDQRHTLNQLAISIRRELQGARAEINEQLMKRQTGRMTRIGRA